LIPCGSGFSRGLSREFQSIPDDQKTFSSAADARKKPAKCTPVREQADDKADAVLLAVFYL
jgi:hypothetical protein